MVFETPEYFRKFTRSLRGLIPSKKKGVLMNIPANAQMYVYHLGVIGEWGVEEDEVHMYINEYMKYLYDKYPDWEPPQ